MAFHTFDPTNAERLEDPARFRFCSREELLQYLPDDPTATLLDHGCGSGFYTDELAPYFGQVYALDRQKPMLDRYRMRGVPANVQPMVGDAETLPLEAATVDAVVSTMTFHEVATGTALEELARILRPDGPLVVVDWSAEGEGTAGPPISERYSLATASDRLRTAGFSVSTAFERAETFLLVVRA